MNVLLGFLYKVDKSHKPSKENDDKQLIRIAHTLNNQQFGLL